MASAVSIGLFNDSFTPVVDGVTLTVRNYAYWLNRMLGPTCVVAPSAPFHREVESFPILRFFSIPTIVHPPYRIGLPCLDASLRRRIERRDFALFHAHSPFGAGRAALRAAREAGAPIVATFHSKFRDNLRLAVPFKRLVEDEMRRIVDFYRAVDRVWVPQPSVADTLREYGYDGPCEVVENGIDYDPPENPLPLRARGAELLGAREGDVVGLFVGQHILEKNLEFLVRELPAIMSAVPRFRMAFVGNGYARSRLEALVDRLGIGGRARFYGQVDDRTALAAIYARGDVFLLPSLWDNAPLVVREAAAFGTPSVLLRGSTAAEPLRDGVNGYLAEEGEGAYAARVVRALEDPEALARAGAEARRTLCRTWEHVVREVRDRYLAIIAGASAAGAAAAGAAAAAEPAAGKSA